MKPALLESFKKLDPRELWRNPVMLCVEIASVITLVTFFMSLTGAKEPAWFTGLVSLWLWLTVIFATFAEALAEGRGKARAASLRKSRTEVTAKRLKKPEFGSGFTAVSAQTSCERGTISLWRREIHRRRRRRGGGSGSGERGGGNRRVGAGGA